MSIYKLLGVYKIEDRGGLRGVCSGSATPEVQGCYDGVHIWVVVKIIVPDWGTLNSRCRCRIILGTQQGTLILTTTHLSLWRVSR